MTGPLRGGELGVGDGSFRVVYCTVRGSLPMTLLPVTRYRVFVLIVLR